MSDNEPVAWAVFEADGTCVCVCSDQKHAQTAIEELAYDGMVCEPLYRAITDAERLAIADALEANESEASLFACEVATKHAATLRGLLERTQKVTP